MEAAWEEVPLKPKHTTAKPKTVVVTEGDASKASLTLELGKNVSAIIVRPGSPVQSSTDRQHSMRHRLAPPQHATPQYTHAHKHVFPEADLRVVWVLCAAQGKGGAVITSLQADTGAKINIEKGQSSCVITGTPEAVGAASARIRAILADVSRTWPHCTALHRNPSCLTLDLTLALTLAWHLALHISRRHSLLCPPLSQLWPPTLATRICRLLSTLAPTSEPSLDAAVYTLTQSSARVVLS